MKKKNKLGLLVLIPAALLMLVGIGFAAYELMLSMVNFKARMGVFGSPFVGLENFERLADSFVFWRILPNGVWQTLLLIAISVPGALLISFLVGLIPLRPIKAAVAGGALLLAVLPTLMWTEMANGVTTFLWDVFSEQGSPATGMWLWSAYWPRFIIARIVPQTALCVFAGLALQLSGKTPPALGVLVAGLVPAMTLLMPDMQTNLLLGNDMNYASSQTLPYYAYQMGLVQAKFSMAGAVNVFGKLVSLIIGLLPALLIAWISGRGCTLERVREERHGWIFEALAALGMAVVVTVVVMAALCLGREMNLEDDSAYNYLSTLGVILMTMPLALVLCAAVLFLSRKADRSILCVLGSAVMILALSQMSIFTLGHYMLAKNLGMLNTIVPVVFSALGNPLFVTLLIVLAALRPVTIRQTIFLALGGAALAGVCAAGEWFGGMIYVSSLDAMPMATYLRMLLTQGATQMGVEGEVISMAPYVNGSIALLTGTCLAIGVPAVVLTMAGVGGSRVQGETK